ncbi:MAG: hypothetical protein ICV63_00535 [Coleofasciculus sp. Co-bin14]|nr:hypothetical protein [Coleofasciculus sp. Co-bin14]
MTEDFDIIALNGITGECLTTADLDDSTPSAGATPDPETQRQFAAFLMGKPVSEDFLRELSTRMGTLAKGLAVSTKDLTRPGADSFPTTDSTI